MLTAVLTALVVCTLRIEGRSNNYDIRMLTAKVVCTLRIEGRSNTPIEFETD